MFRHKLNPDQVVCLGDLARFHRLPGPNKVSLWVKPNVRLSLPIGEVISTGGPLRLPLDVGASVVIDGKITVTRTSLTGFGVDAPREIDIRVETRPSSQPDSGARYAA